MGHGKDREVKTCAGPVGCVVNDGSVTSYTDDTGGMSFVCFVACMHVWNHTFYTPDW